MDLEEHAEGGVDRKQRTNESILQEMGEMRGSLSLLQRAKRQTMMFFGNVMRVDGLE